MRGITRKGDTSSVSGAGAVSGLTVWERKSPSLRVRGGRSISANVFGERGWAVSEVGAASASTVSGGGAVSGLTVSVWAGKSASLKERGGKSNSAEVLGGRIWTVSEVGKVSASTVSGVGVVLGSISWKGKSVLTCVWRVGSPSTRVWR